MESIRQIGGIYKRESFVLCNFSKNLSKIAIANPVKPLYNELCAKNKKNLRIIPGISWRIFIVSSQMADRLMDESK
jgi:hypothetical protein